MQLRKEKDEVLKQVSSRIRNGWPQSKKKLTAELHPYSDWQLQLTMQEGCILCGLKVVIPLSLRERVLEEIHEQHTGIVKMKSIARMHVWWPKDARVMQTLSTLSANVLLARKTLRIQQKYHFILGSNQDNCGRDFTLILLVLSKDLCGLLWWMHTQNGQKWFPWRPQQQVELLWSFDRSLWGLAFLIRLSLHISSEEYQQFCVRNGIWLTLVAPYHPSSNGEAERFVQTFKSAIHRAQPDVVEKALLQFLLHYWTTPHHTTPNHGKNSSWDDVWPTNQDQTWLLHPLPKVQQPMESHQYRPLGENGIWENLILEIQSGCGTIRENQSGYLELWWQKQVLSATEFVHMVKNIGDIHIDQLRKRSQDSYGVQKSF